MTPQYIYAPPDPDGSEGMLAIVLRSSDLLFGTQFFTEPDQPLQVGTVIRPKGALVSPHRHLERPRTIARTQEVLIVRSGKIRLQLYRTSGEGPVKEVVLFRGDVAILLTGGHGLEWLEDGELLEVKQGPYPVEGRQADKVNL